jgi:hypothetical protein
MSFWLEIPRRRPDGRQEASGRTSVRLAFQISWKFFPDGVALSSGRSHFSCTQFPYQGLVRLDHDICCPDGESDARNFHI